MATSNCPINKKNIKYKKFKKHLTKVFFDFWFQIVLVYFFICELPLWLIPANVEFVCDFNFFCVLFFFAFLILTLKLFCAFETFFFAAGNR